MIDKLFTILLALYTSLSFAELKPDRSEYDFGQLSNIDSASIDVTLQNTGSKAVKLEAVRLSCGCATANYKKGSTVKPQEKSVITIQFSPKEFSGRVRKPFYIKYKELGEAGKSETLRLFIRAKVKKEVVISPDPLVFNPVVDGGKKTFTLTNNSGMPLTNLKLKLSREFCIIQISEEFKTLNSGESRTFKIQVKPDFQSDKVEYCKIQFSGEKDAKAFNLESVIKFKANR